MNWQEVCDSSYFKNLPFKIELNHWGQVIMSPAKTIHSGLQWRIQRAIYKLMGENGEVLPECPIETRDGTKVADVVWISNEKYQKVKYEEACSIAPEICVEVISASNTRQEMLEKKALYLEVGAQEIWLCTQKGQLSFYNQDGELSHSLLIPAFPKSLEI